MLHELRFSKELSGPFSLILRFQEFFHGTMLIVENALRQTAVIIKKNDQLTLELTILSKV